jgi:hypothetical protein
MKFTHLPTKRNPSGYLVHYLNSVPDEDARRTHSCPNTHRRDQDLFPIQ